LFGAGCKRYKPAPAESFSSIEFARFTIVESLLSVELTETIKKLLFQIEAGVSF
jgi:hypothetical protein